MAFARWDPVRDLLAIQQQMDRFAPSPSGWMPPADLHETPQEYVLSAELPGLTTGDIHIDFQDGRLTVSGTRSERTPCEGYQRIERGHGSFRRTLQLPLPVDADQITADLRDGVLTVRCPKSSAAAQRIRIS